MTKKFFMIGILTLVGAGCGQKATYIETGGTQSVVNVDQVNIQDILNASSDLLDSLISNGVLKQAKNQPARVVVDNVTNATSTRFDIDELLMRMRAQLVNSGQATVETSYGNDPESRAAQEALRSQAFREGTTAEAFDPDFALTGKITQLRASAGRMKQTTYSFRLTLTNMRTGREVWTEVADMTKQGTKPGVGF
ncbi:MAG: penicillin-binding protein activator LpoB [Phycisphaerales bacterium]|nr:penicillin-binding protein activator LpoB [Phycisphaerales bacterium]